MVALTIPFPANLAHYYKLLETSIPTSNLTHDEVVYSGSVTDLFITTSATGPVIHQPGPWAGSYSHQQPSTSFPNQLLFYARPGGGSGLTSNSLDPGPSTNYSFEMWIKPTAFDPIAGQLIDLRYVSFGEPHVTLYYDEHGAVKLQLIEHASGPNTGTGVSNYSTANGVIVLGAWQHIAWTIGGGVYDVYVNGVLVLTCSGISYSGVQCVIRYFNNPDLTGRWTPFAYFTEFVEWNKTLTATEVVVRAALTIPAGRFYATLV